jgi:hypothetical protein
MISLCGAKVFNRSADKLYVGGSMKNVGKTLAALGLILIVPGGIPALIGYMILKKIKKGKADAILRRV